jgi:hypothetical protein
MAVSRALPNAGLARHFGALQADVNRRNLGNHPPVSHLSGADNRVREDWTVTIAGGSLRIAGDIGPTALDALFQRNERRLKQFGHQR